MSAWRLIALIPAALAGAIVPLEISSRTFLRKELKNRGIPYSAIPPSCIDEIATGRLMTARRTAPYIKKSATELLVYSLEDDADRIAEIMGMGSPSRNDSTLQQEARKNMVALLQRHGVGLGQV